MIRTAWRTDVRYDLIESAAIGGSTVATSKNVARLASRELKTQTSKAEKSVAASDLSQAKKKPRLKRGRG